MPNDRRLLLVHAHPDDESSQSSATMARYLSEGAQVTLVTCTLGELGEILVPEWAKFTPAELGQHRLAEVAVAMSAVGLSDHVFLGGPGRYHDSGMATDEAGKVQVPETLPPDAFWSADLEEAANYLVEVIRDRRPQVLITYDPNGNYGHPDHIQAHRVAMYAMLLAASPAHRGDLGEPWSISRVLWLTHDGSGSAEAIRIARARGIELWPESQDEVTTARIGSDPEQIVAMVETAPWLDVARTALAAHRSQVDTEAPFWQFYRIRQELPGAGEAYRLGYGEPFPATGHRAKDLFAGLQLDPQQ